MEMEQGRRIAPPERCLYVAFTLPLPFQDIQRRILDCHTDGEHSNNS